MKISWDGEALVIDLAGDILISPTGGLGGPEHAVQLVTPLPFAVKIQGKGGTLVETSPEIVARIEQNIRTMLKAAPGAGRSSGAGGVGGSSPPSGNGMAS